MVIYYDAVKAVSRGENLWKGSCLALKSFKCPLIFLPKVTTPAGIFLKIHCPWCLDG